MWGRNGAENAVEAEKSAPFAPARLTLRGGPARRQYMARCVERPAYEKAFGPGAARARGYVAAQGGGGAAPKKTFGLF